MTSSALLFVHAITPLHAGVGQGAGDIDLPIARERSTSMPYLPGSSIKGALRALAPAQDTVKLFGPDTSNADHAGSVQVSDARLLFLPVRSMRGVFAYATSPLLLRRYLRDRQDAGVTAGVPELPSKGPSGDEGCVVAAKGGLLEHEKKVYLEDLSLRTTNADFTTFDKLEDLLGVDGMASRVCIVSDDVMSFLADTATELRARIRLDENARSVAKGGLWYEESLPAESVLSGVVYARAVGDKKGAPVTTAQEAMSAVGSLVAEQGVVQLGGKATVGRGVCRLKLVPGAAR